MPKQINAAADFYVALEGDITGADATNDGTTSGNASISPAMAVGYYNATLPTISNGTPGAFQVDSSGRLIIAPLSTLALESGGNLAGIRTDLGTDGTSPPTLPGGSTGVRGWLRYLASLLPSLASGRWPVDGSGVTQPISGTVTANTGLSQPLTDTQLRATALPVSLASLPSLAVGSNSIGAVTNLGIGAPADSAATSDVGTFSLIALFKRYIARLFATRLYVSSAPSSSGDNTIITAPAAGIRIVITSIRIQNTSGTSTSVLIKDGASTTLQRLRTTSDGSGLSEVYSMGGEIRLTAATAFVVNLSGASAHDVSVIYYLETASTGLP